MLLSKHFHLKEFTQSPTAKKLGINNDPNEKQLQNLQQLSRLILEPIRLFLNRSVTINSGYRAPALNKEVGGTANSVHTMGLAADLALSKEEQQRLMQWLQRNTIPFDQAISYPTRGFIHLSLSPQNTPRRQLLLSTIKGVYQFYS
ncbi:MAG: D-Ala-D-Ala carboxypeptidase family metallohydrolase [Brevinema sp.]